MKGSVQRDFDDAASIVVEWMKENGFADVVLADDAGRGAFDLTAKDIVAEITVEAPPNRPNIQRLDQVARGEQRQGALFSVRGFTMSAEEWAANVNVALFQFERNTDNIVATNSIAEDLLADPPSDEERLMSALERGLATGWEELQEEQQLAGADDETKDRILEARRLKKMRHNLLG